MSQASVVVSSSQDKTGIRAYQQAGRAWLVERLRDPGVRAVLLADDCGLGKSLQTIMALNDLDARRTLIVSPASARPVWRAEIMRWRPSWMQRVIMLQPGVNLSELDLSQPDAIVIVTYDVLSARDSPLAVLLATLDWDVLVLDEAHYLKNGGANRTQAVYGDRGIDQGIQAHAKKVILLTGTPAPNHVGELYHHVRTFWPETILARHTPRPMSEPEFQDRYTRWRDTQWGRQIVGSQRQDELRQALKPFILRRTKQQVLPELPPVIAQDIPLETLDAAGLDCELPFRVRSAAWALDATLRRAQDDNEVLSTLTSHAANLAALRSALGEYKVNAVLAWAEERLACGIDKLIIFGWHQAVLHRLTQLLAAYDPVLITGATSPSGRTRAVEHFQTRPRTRVFVGQIQAAGTAITLTAANEVAIVEPSWVPAENYQAISRAHRLGQHDSVLASFLFIPGSLDEIIMRTFRRKAAELGAFHQDHQQQRSASGGDHDRDPIRHSEDIQHQPAD